MKPAKNFDEYVKDGTIRKVSVNKAKAEFLINESQNSLAGLKERIKIIGINDKNANSIIIKICKISDSAINSEVCSEIFSIANF